VVTRQRDADDTAALVAIQRLQAAYGDAVTRRAWDDVRTLFEPDAVVHITTHTRDPFTLDGPDGVAAFVERSLEQFSSFVFTIENAVAEVDRDEGTGRVYIGELRHHRDGTWTQAHGLYQDRYRRRDGTWRIAERRYSSLARVGDGVESFPLPPIET
jgi:SnoaL-like domain